MYIYRYKANELSPGVNVKKRGCKHTIQHLVHCILLTVINNQLLDTRSALTVVCPQRVPVSTALRVREKKECVTL